MSKALADVFRHNLWANLKVLDWCAGLADELWDTSGPGMYGSVRDTLTHLVRAEANYVGRLRGQPPERLWNWDEGFPGFDRLRESARRSGEGLIAYAEGMDPAQTVNVKWQDGRVVELSASVVVIQAINHATEHREQVKMALSQRGVAAPDVDGWTYAEETMM